MNTIISAHAQACMGWLWLVRLKSSLMWGQALNHASLCSWVIFHGQQWQNHHMEWVISAWFLNTFRLCSHICLLIIKITEEIKKNIEEAILGLFSFFLKNCQGFRGNISRTMYDSSSGNEKQLMRLCKAFLGENDYDNVLPSAHICGV